LNSPPEAGIHVGFQYLVLFAFCYAMNIVKCADE